MSNPSPSEGLELVKALIDAGEMQVEEAEFDDSLLMQQCFLVQEDREINETK